VVRDKTKKMTQRNSCTTQPKQIFAVLQKQKHSPYSWNFVHDYKMTPHFLDDELGKSYGKFHKSIFNFFFFIRLTFIVYRVITNILSDYINLLVRK
jgi:hypothetical protein